VTSPEVEPGGRPTPIQAAEELERELYWAGPPDPTTRPTTVALVPDSDLAVRWNTLESTLRRDHSVPYPPDEEVLTAGGGWKLTLKRLIWRGVRPVSRRYDRLGADTARLGFETAQEVSTTQRDMDALREAIQALTAEVRSLHAEVNAVGVTSHEHDVRIGSAASKLEILAGRLESTASRGNVPASHGAPPAAAGPPLPAGAIPARSAPMPDAFYWRFEAAMRGTSESVEEKLEQYEDLARDLLEEAAGTPLWIDLGCGEGQFASLLARWGWRVLGMDISPQAVETCRQNGIDAVVGSLPSYLADYRGEAPSAFSAIQVIEHLPPEEWLATFQFAHEALAPGGMFLIETIDPRNMYALANWFFGDITHTWPANPETLKVMAGFAGFAAAEIISMNPDAEGKGQDFALVARKAA
jgi:SAM-dependent methyltransferase